MKKLLLLSILLFTLGAQAKMQNYKITCTGVTHEKDTYVLTTKFRADSSVFECGDPCDFELENAHAYANIRVYRQGKLIHNKTHHVPHVVVMITDDQTSYYFDDYVENHIDIIPGSADSGEADHMNFLLGGASGLFNNARCS